MRQGWDTLAEGSRQPPGSSRAALITLMVVVCGLLGIKDETWFWLSGLVICWVWGIIAAVIYCKKISSNRTKRP